MQTWRKTGITKKKKKKRQNDQRLASAWLTPVAGDWVHINQAPWSLGTQSIPLCGLAESEHVAFSINYGLTGQKVKHFWSALHLQSAWFWQRSWTHQEKVISSMPYRKQRTTSLSKEPLGYGTFQDISESYLSFWLFGAVIESPNHTIWPTLKLSGLSGISG